MNWLKENSFLIALLGATLVLAGALLFLMTQAMSQYHETVETYQLAVRKLQALQNRSPFPSAENLEKSRTLVDQYKAELNSLRDMLAKFKPPHDNTTKIEARKLQQKIKGPNISDVQPQEFQDDLRVALNQIVEKAAAAGVELPTGFYLGFSQYANSPPNERAAPILARQLQVIEKVVTNLIDLKVHSIDSLNRIPLPEESGSPPVKAAEDPSKPGKPSPKPSGYTRMPFDLAFTAEQGKLRLGFNSLLDSEHFLVVRNLAVQNTARVGPPLARQSPPSATLSTSPATGSTNAVDHSPAGGSSAQKRAENPGSLNVILGRELVKTSMRIEIVDFATPSHVTN